MDVHDADYEPYCMGRGRLDDVYRRHVHLHLGDGALGGMDGSLLSVVAEMTAAEWKQQAYDTMTEAAFGGKVEKIAREAGWLYYHTWQSQHSAPGFPDYCFVRAGWMFFAELKTNKGRLTEHQIKWRDALITAGQMWTCWRPENMDELIAILEGPQDEWWTETLNHRCYLPSCHCSPMRKVSKRGSGQSNRSAAKRTRSRHDQDGGPRSDEADNAPNPA